MRSVKLLVLAAIAFHAGPAAAAPCDDLIKFALPGTTVTGVEMVAAGRFSPSDTGGRGSGQQFAKLPAFCRAMVTTKPTSDSDIKIEVWMPAAGWNGKLQAIGQGGLAGSIPYAEMATALAAGYAT